MVGDLQLALVDSNSILDVDTVFVFYENRSTAFVYRDTLPDVKMRHWCLRLAKLSGVVEVKLKMIRAI